MRSASVWRKKKKEKKVDQGVTWVKYKGVEAPVERTRRSEDWFHLRRWLPYYNSLFLIIHLDAMPSASDASLYAVEISHGAPDLPNRKPRQASRKEEYTYRETSLSVIWLGTFSPELCLRKVKVIFFPMYAAQAGRKKRIWFGPSWCYRVIYQTNALSLLGFAVWIF